MKKLKAITENNKVISVIGNVKNAGKTTVINAVLSQIEYRNIAITSIGLDGEELDQVTFLEKPRIYALEGYLIATASQTLEKFEAEYEIIEETNIFTSIGKIHIVKITKAGNALIAGPSIISDIEKLLVKLLKYNLKNIFIDGAFSRHSLAKVAGTTLYVIGANLSVNIDTVVEDSYLNFMKFNLKKAPKELVFLQNNTNVCLVNEQYEIKEFNIESLIGNSHKIFSEENKKFQFIYLPRALSNDFASMLIEKRREYKFDIIVDSPVNIQLNIANLRNIFKLDTSVYVLNDINIGAIFYNPVSPKGYSFNENEFRRKLENKLGTKVYNVMRGSVE